MQGVRQAKPNLGEIVVVIGLGLIGQITVQLLKAAGCEVIGIDLDDKRIQSAIQHGADYGFSPSNGELKREVDRITDGHGADITIITAATSSNAPIQQSMELTRKKGRVVVVGAVGLGINRSPFYEKEIDLHISCSYGPGRYDPVYEQEGLDYPYAYIRWTENRNMQSFVKLIALGKINLDTIIQKEFDVSEAPEAYKALMESTDKPLGVVLRYSSKNLEEKKAPRVNISKVIQPTPGKIGVALIGAGSFAKSTHLPNLQKLSNLYELRAIVSASGLNAKKTALQFNVPYATTAFEDVLNDPSINLVMICTRHNLHASMVMESLRAGKNVFVEKPLALTEEELNKIASFFADGVEDKPILMTGFNRRFSPFIDRIVKVTNTRKDPMIINYRMNAGYIPLDHWVHSAEGGGRNIGEACHIYDLFVYLTGSEAVSINASSILPTSSYYSSKDNFTVSIKFADGSLGNLVYTALGNDIYPKENIDVFVDGEVITLVNYQNLNFWGCKSLYKTKNIDKGHSEELIKLAEAIIKETEWPISLQEQLVVTNIALEIEQLL